MSAEQNVWSDDDEGSAVLYSYTHLPAGEGYAMADIVGDRGESEHYHSNCSGERVVSALPVPSAAITPGSPPGGPDENMWYADSSLPVSGQGLVRSSRDAWPHGYRRAFTATFNGVIFALGLLLGTLAPGFAKWSFVSPHLPSVHYAHSPVATQQALSGGVSTTTTPNAPFAIATLRVQCMLSPCAKTQYVPAGQRIYAPQAEVSCTTLNAVAVVGQREEYVDCRMDQPGAFIQNLEGAQFYCIGSRLGCHNVVVVK